MNDDYELHIVYIYIIFNCKGYKYLKSDDVFYVGQTKQGLMERHYSHKSSGKTMFDKVLSSHKHYYLTPDEYCFYGFKKDTDCMEKFLIKTLQSLYYTGGYGFNIEEGGYYTKTITPEQRKRLSDMCSGEKNPMYGHSGPLAPNWGKGYKINQYTLDGKYIKTWSSAREIEETLGINAHDLRSVAIGAKNRKKKGGYMWRKYEGDVGDIPPYEIKISSESKKKQIHEKPVDQYTLEGVFIKTFKSIKDAKKELGNVAIDKCAKGKRKTAGGFIWKYHKI